MNKIPLVVLIKISISIAIFIYCNVGDKDEILPYLTLSVDQILESPWAVYRLFSSAFTHLSILHIGMNMLSFYSLGSSLERLHGSLLFMWLLTLYAILIGGLIVLVNALFTLTWGPLFWFQRVAGYSGVIFALAVDETASSPHPYRSVFGLFRVPTKLYPWVLLIALQFLLPNVSFVGHLAGILVGGLHVAGWLRFLLPTYETCRKIEDKPWFRPIRTLYAYKLTPSTDPALLHSGSFFGPTWQAILTILRPITDCLRITGRTRHQNAHPSDAERTSYASGSGSGSASAGSRGPRVDEFGNIQRDASVAISSPHMDRSRQSAGTLTSATESVEHGQRKEEIGLPRGAAVRISTAHAKAVHPNVLFSDEAVSDTDGMDSYDEEQSSRMGLLSHTDHYFDDALIDNDVSYEEREPDRTDASASEQRHHNTEEHVAVTVSTSRESSFEPAMERQRRLDAIEKRLAPRK